MTDLEDVHDLRSLRVSRLTVGLLMSVAATSGIVVWQAAQLANRIGGLESTVVEIQQATGAEYLERLEVIGGAVATNADRIDDLHAARISDLERFVPDHVVAVLVGEVSELERRVEALEDGR